MNGVYTSNMEFLCYASGNYHQNIYLTKEMDAYVCWHDLSRKDQNWHANLDKSLQHDKEREAFRKLPPQNLMILGDFSTPSSNDYPE